MSKKWWITSAKISVSKIKSKNSCPKGNYYFLILTPQTGTQGNSQQGSGFNQQQGNSHQGSGSNQQQGNAQGSGFNQHYEPGAIYENNSCGPNGCVSSGVQVADGLPQGKREINASIIRAYYFKMFQKSQCLLAVMK